MNPLLRYPGGKSRQAKDIVSILGPSDLFVEPFVGGGSVALEYAIRHPSAEIVLMDANPLLSSFWNAVVFEPRKLCSVLEHPTLDIFNQQLAYCGNDTILLAKKCLTINKCSFNGYMHPAATPVGGKNQTGKWLIDWCWQTPKIASRIMDIHNLLAGRTTVSDDTSIGVIGSFGEKSVIYLDPPYFKEGPKLYNDFGVFDHKLLSDVLRGSKSRWLLSYDDMPEIRELYNEFNVLNIEVLASRKIVDGKMKKNNELIITNFNV